MIRGQVLRQHAGALMMCDDKTSRRIDRTEALIKTAEMVRSECQRDFTTVANLGWRWTPWQRFPRAQLRWAREPSALSPLNADQLTLQARRFRRYSALLRYIKGRLNQSYSANIRWQYWPLSFPGLDMYWVEYSQDCTQCSSCQPDPSKHLTLCESVHTVIMVEGL